MAQPQKVEAKWKGKEWYQILAPKYIGDIVIGETLATDAEKLKGRIVEASLMDLTGDPAKHHIKLFFKITEIAGNKALTKFIGHEVMRDFITRAVQSRTTRIDSNDVISFTDGKLRIKGLAITNRPVSKAVDKAIRSAIRNAIAGSANGKKIEEWVSIMASGELQRTIRNELNKIYPIRMFEIRASELIES
ncbi:MAG: 30S ribosomal protein S3ae [Candidatus Aenigmatarchaeota archaeon]